MHRQIVEVDRMHLIVDTVGPPLDRELVPYLLAQLHRAVRAVHAQKRNATQDEWHDGGIELRVRREADRRDTTADFHGRQQPREQVAAETVDRAGKDRLVERTDLGEVDRLPQANLLRAQAAQIRACIFLAGDRDDVIAPLGEDLDGHAADAAGRSGHGHRSLVGLEPGVLHEHDRLRRGEPGRAQRHGVERGHGLGAAHHPVGRNAGVFGVAAIVRNAEVIGMDDHLVAALPAGIVRRLDGARHVDSRVGRVFTHDLARPVVRQRILVIDRRIFGAHDDVARIELVDAHLDKAAHDGIVFLERPVGLEFLHGSSPSGIGRVQLRRRGHRPIAPPRAGAPCNRGIAFR